MSEIKLSVFSVATPDLEPDQLAASAQKAGIHGIEWRYQDIPVGQENAKPSYWGHNRCSIPTRWDEAQLEVFRDAALSHGLESKAVVPYVASGDLAGTERVLQAAKFLGASFIRLGNLTYDRSRPYPELFAAQRVYVKEAEALCRHYGVKGVLETHHGTITPSTSAAYRVVEGMDPDFIGVLFDPGNMVFEGYENYRMSMEMLGPYLAHIHAKNAGWKKTESDEGGFVRWNAEWSGLKKGVVEWRQVVADLKAVGYRGSIGIEDFSGELDSREMLVFFVNTMRRLIG